MIYRNTKHIVRIVLTAVIFTTAGITSFAQSNIAYRNHFLHRTFINPAVSGSEFFPVANISHQKQWLGISGSPQTFAASTSLRMGNYDFYNPKMFINKSKLKTYERVGMGLGIYGDRNGPIATRGVNLAYSYHLGLDNARLSFGLAGIAEQSMLDETKWAPTIPGDPVLGNQKESIYNFNANFGVLFYCPDYFVGLSMNNFLPLDNKSIPGDLTRQDIMLQAGYIFGKLNDLKFEPVVDLRLLDYSKFEFDLMLKMYIQHVHWVAVSYRSYQAINVMAGYKIGKIYIAYSYEANLSPLIKYNAGTHGFNIGLNLGIRRLEGF